MSRSTGPPWHKRNITAGDLAIFMVIAVMVLGLIIGLIYYMVSKERIAAAAEPTDAPASVTDLDRSADTGQAEAGEVIFQEKCTACHTLGGGRLVGPDLQGVTAMRDRGWLLAWIARPDEILAQGDPIATELLAEFNNVPMPNLGLTEEEAAEVLAYIELNTVAAPDQAAEPMPDLMLTSGSVEGGRLLFVGEVQLANGGPACISCHNVAGVGALGGGTLGPDLTSVYNRYGEKGLAAALEGLPFPTMQGVFGDKPLRSDEAAHLFAFFVQANKYSAEPADEYFVWIGLGGFLSLLVISHLIWRLRLRAVRKPLLGRHA